MHLSEEKIRGKERKEWIGKLEREEWGNKEWTDGKEKAYRKERNH